VATNKQAMNEALKQFSADLGKELQKKLETSEVKEFISKVKASGDDRTFEVVMSTSDEDRQGDSLDQSTWDFKYFDMNPVVLFAHDYSSFPIGIITDIEIKGNEAVATGKFAPEGINPAADMACALYQQKILRAVSPGYIQNDDGSRELLEVSFCPVPAGRYALSMRQVRALGVSTRELVTKGFFYNEKKAEQAGDPCELEDGSPGVLADSGGDGKLVCVPTEDKSQKSTETQMNEMEKQLKAEHERHGTEVAKAIDEFSEKCMKCEKAGDKSEFEKAIDEYTKAMDGEQADHLTKCMKAIDDSYDTMGREPNKPEKAHKKDIEEFKSEMTGEHLTHVKACDKAIDEFTKDWQDGDPKEDKKKAIDEFTKSMGDELDRHEKSHMEMVKAEADRMGADEDEKKAAAEVEQKSGRAISAVNGEKIKAVIKALEEHHEAHGVATQNVIASLKELSSSPQDDEGEEQKPEKKAAALKPRSSTSGANAEMETYIFTQRLVRQVKTASEGALRQINEKIKETRSSGR
jgi:hypothetical protein